MIQNHDRNQRDPDVPEQDRRPMLQHRVQIYSCPDIQDDGDRDQIRKDQRIAHNFNLLLSGNPYLFPVLSSGMLHPQRALHS